MKSPSQTHAWSIPTMRNLEVLRANLVDHRFPPHFHDTFVLEWVERGRDHCSRANLSAKSGQLFVHGPGVVHAGTTGTRSALRYIGCYPSKELTEELFEAPFESLRSVGTIVLENKWITKAAKRLFAELAQGCNNQSTRRALRHVLKMVFDHAPEQNTAPAPLPASLVRAKAHLARETRRNVSLDELEQIAGLSRFHLTREFSRWFGITPKQFALSQRVSVAKTQIMQGIPIAEVALETGFSDQSHLNRCFKRVTGFRPGQIQGDGNSAQDRL